MKTILVFYFKCKTYIGMFCIYKINKLFGIIPRLKHYKDVINIPFLTFRHKFNYLTIPFHNDAKKTFAAVESKEDPMATLSI